MATQTHTHRRTPPADSKRNITNTSPNTCRFLADTMDAQHITTHRVRGQHGSQHRTQIKRRGQGARQDTHRCFHSQPHHAHVCAASPPPQTAQDHANAPIRDATGRGGGGPPHLSIQPRRSQSAGVSDFAGERVPYTHR